MRAARARAVSPCAECGRDRGNRRCPAAPGGSNGLSDDSAEQSGPPMRVVVVRLVLYGPDGRTLADALAPVRSGRGLDVPDATAAALQELRETAWPPGRVESAMVEVEVVEERAPGRYRYRVLGRSGSDRTRCLFECQVSAGNPVLAKTIGAFCRKEKAREAGTPVPNQATERAPAAKQRAGARPAFARGASAPALGAH